jgi:hypothetical protein
MIQYPSEFKEEKYFYNIFKENGLLMGRMISGSKSYYRERFPKHLVIFNANIIIINDKKVWHGDLDITIDENKLKNVAKILNQDLYILYEYDARFGNEDKPIDELIKKAAYIIKK